MKHTRTAEIDGARTVYYLNADNDIRVISFQIFGGLGVNLGAESVSLERCRLRWPTHNDLWLSIERMVQLSKSEPTPHRRPRTRRKCRNGDT